MYQVNLLNRRVLITPSEVLFHTDMDEIDPKSLWASIIVAEERFVKKMVCKDLYEDLRLKKNVIVTADNISQITQGANAGNNTGVQLGFSVGQMVNAIDLLDPAVDQPYIDLWNEYLWKICAECVYYVSMPTRWLQSKPGGEMLNNPPIIGGGGQEAGSADLKSVQWKAGKILSDRIDPMLEVMKEYLCDNQALYPKFTCHHCPEPDLDGDCDTQGVSYKGKTGWVMNIYDDVDQPRRRRNYNQDNY